jgi:hypothetical protein
LYVVVCVHPGLYMSGHVYNPTAWPASRNASSHVEMQPQSSTRCSGLFESQNYGMLASDGVGVQAPFLGVWSSL